MQQHEISEHFTASTQIQIEDLAVLKAQGYASIISNRPDAELDGQPSFAQIQAAAHGLGMQARYIPVIPGNITAQNQADFGDALAQMPTPILAYCLSGKRASTLWDMHQRWSSS